MQNSNILPVNATPVANSNNEARLVQAAQAVVDAAKDKKSKKAAEMSRTARFNEVTRMAHRMFLKCCPAKAAKYFDADMFIKLKYAAIKEAVGKYELTHNYHMADYKQDFMRRVRLLTQNGIFVEYVKNEKLEPKAVAEHVVFNGIAFYEKVMIHDYLEHGTLTITGFPELEKPIFIEKENDDVAQNAVA